ncbi:MAG: cupin domain-containing protein [Opitutales bacterium]|nr:cupin domain-containing protein [Opitutales bacterium]
MNARIHRTPEAEEFFFKEGCHILELWNDCADREVSIARARVPKGGLTRWHRLVGTTERYLILEGEGSVQVGELPPAKVERGSVVVIPPGNRQRIRNTGQRDLVFLAVCSPRFRPEAYQDLET